MCLKSFLILKAEIRSLIFLDSGKVKISDTSVIQKYMTGCLKVSEFVRKPNS